MYNGWEVDIHGWFPSMMMLAIILDTMLAMSPMTLVSVATLFFLFLACFIFLKEFIIALKFFLFHLLLLFFLVLKSSFVTFIPFCFFFCCSHVLWILHCTCHYHQYNVIALITFSYPQIQLQCIHMCWLYL